MKAIIEGIYFYKQKGWEHFDPFEVEIDDCLPDYQNSDGLGSVCNTDQIYRYCDYWENSETDQYQIVVRFIL